MSFRAEFQVPSLAGVFDEEELVYAGAHDGLRGLGQAAAVVKQQIAADIAAGRTLPVLPTAPESKGPPIAMIVGGVVVAVVIAMALAKKK